MYEKAAGAVPSAGIVTGIGVVAGTPCVVSANDSCVKGGTYFPMTNKKALVPCHRFARRVRSPRARAPQKEPSGGDPPL